MPQLRESGPYIYPTWLTKLIAGLDSRKTGRAIPGRGSAERCSI